MFLRNSAVKYAFKNFHKNTTYRAKKKEHELITT